VGRRRKIFKEDILNASFDIVREEGFKNFTARRVAKKLQSSTQPIYKEFNGMDQIKKSLMKCIKTFMNENIFVVYKEDQSIVEVCLNYIQFAKEEPTFFRALFLDQALDVTELHEFSYHFFVEAIKNDAFENEEELTKIIWPSVHGMAVLMAQGQLQLSEEEMAHTLKQLVQLAV
jgi:AcrR family transcriptional regulator